jgi:hypothetical protein
MTAGSNPEAQINLFIEKSVRDYWDEQKKALLLSYLGSNLRNVFPDSDTVLIKGLRRHLETWPIATIVSHPTQKEKIGLIPLDAKMPSDTSELFPTKDQHTALRPRSDYTLFRQDFWNSFQSPIRTKKFIVVTGDQNFLISEAIPKEVDASNVHELREEDLVIVPTETPAPEKAKLVRAKLEAWLQRNSLNPRIFEQQRGTVEPANAPSRGLFDAFATLEPADQARISIPLDIVVKLLRKQPK